MAQRRRRENMIARGKREARRPWSIRHPLKRALKARNKMAIISLFQSFIAVPPFIQGRHTSLCSVLAPGFISRAFGAAQIDFEGSRGAIDLGSGQRPL